MSKMSAPMDSSVVAKITGELTALRPEDFPGLRRDLKFALADERNEARLRAFAKKHQAHWPLADENISAETVILLCLFWCRATHWLGVDRFASRSAVSAVRWERTAFNRDTALAVSLLAKHIDVSSVKQTIKQSASAWRGEVRRITKRVVPTPAQKKTGQNPKGAGRRANIESQLVIELGSLLLAAGLTRRQAATHVAALLRDHVGLRSENRTSVASIEVVLRHHRKPARN